MTKLKTTLCILAIHFVWLCSAPAWATCVAPPGLGKWTNTDPQGDPYWLEVAPGPGDTCGVNIVIVWTLQANGEL